MNYIEANNKVTLKTLDINRTPDIIKSVKGRLTEVYNMCKEHMNKDMSFLDLGTKDGLFFDVLVDEGFDRRKLIGIDCCNEVVDMCIEKGYLTFQEDIQDMSSVFKDGLFDFIFIIHTLEHVPNPVKVVSECERLLKPNGCVFVEVPIQSQIDDPELWGHFHPFTTKQQVKDLFNNFDIMGEDWQKTKSKSPWYRVLFKLKG